MAEIINLRRVKKAKIRADADATAARNRIEFGRSKAERKITEADRALSQTRLDGHLREKDSKFGRDE